MRIFWLNGGYFDTMLDRSTWQEVIACLTHKGYHTTLLTSYRKKPLAFGFPIVYLPCIRAKFFHYLTFNLSAALRLLKEVWRARLECIIVNMDSIPGTLPLVLLKRLGFFRGKIFLDIRTTPVSPSRTRYRLDGLVMSTAIWIARRCFDGIMMITPAMKELLTQRFGLQSVRVGVWTSGVNLKRFDLEVISEEAITKLRRTLGLEGKFVVMYHGFQAMNRGLQEAVQAVALASREIEPLCLIFLGEGPARASLEAEVQKLGIQLHIVFIDPVPYERVPLYLALADAVILPFPDLLQWRVSSPLKLLEALALGRAVIVTDIEAHRFVLTTEHPCAFFAETNQPEPLARTLVRAYTALRDHAYRKRCHLEGRRLVEERFTWEQQAGALLELCAISEPPSLQSPHHTQSGFNP